MELFKLDDHVSYVEDRNIRENHACGKHTEGDNAYKTAQTIAATEVGQ